MESTGYCFAINTDNIDKYGDENSATNHMLEITFGLRHGTDSELTEEDWENI